MALIGILKKERGDSIPATYVVVRPDYCGATCVDTGNDYSLAEMLRGYQTLHDAAQIKLEALYKTGDMNDA